MTESHVRKVFLISKSKAYMGREVAEGFAQGSTVRSCDGELGSLC